MLPNRAHFATLAIFLTLPSHIASWSYPAYVNLAWPPITNQGYITQNSTFTTDHGQNDPVFPCGLVTVSPNQKRTPYPTTGGFLQFDTVNNTDAMPGHKYIITPYFSQIDASPPNDTSYVDTYVYKNFKTREDCAPSDGSINATRLINDAILGHLDYYDTGLNIRGMNATLGLRSVLFDKNGNNVEEMYQCSYVTFVTPSEFAASGAQGLCANAQVSGSVPTGSGFGSYPTGSSPTFGAGDPFSFPTGYGGDDPDGDSLPQHTVRAAAIGIGIGVSAGAVIFFILVGALFLRRRRRPGPTMPLDFFTGWGAMRSKKDKDRKEADVVVGDAESVRSEAPPTYQEATKGESIALGRVRM